MNAPQYYVIRTLSVCLVISYNDFLSGWARLFKIVRLNYGFSLTGCSDGRQYTKPMRSALKFCMDFQTK